MIVYVSVYTFIFLRGTITEVLFDDNVQQRNLEECIIREGE